MRLPEHLSYLVRVSPWIRELLQDLAEIPPRSVTPMTFSCGALTHENIKSTWENFREGTRNVRYWPAERLYMAECKICGTTLAVPWHRNPQHKTPKTSANPGTIGATGDGS